jgi:hypothetical protein
MTEESSVIHLLPRISLVALANLQWNASRMAIVGNETDRARAGAVTRAVEAERLRRETETAAKP